MLPHSHRTEASGKRDRNSRRSVSDGPLKRQLPGIIKALDLIYQGVAVSHKEWELGDKYLLKNREFNEEDQSHTVLSNLSGGIDSVYGTYKLLLAGERVLIHHCHLTSRHRMRYESVAVARVLEWFNSQGLTNYEYIDSAAVLPPAPHMQRMRDPEIVMAMAGTILRARPWIKRLAYWNIVGDTSTKYPDGKVIKARTRMMYICARRRNIHIERPLQEMTKTEILSDMPKELFELCFWCRFPLEDGSPCRTECTTCVDVYSDPSVIAKLTMVDDEAEPPSVWEQVVQFAKELGEEILSGIKRIGKGFLWHGKVVLSTLLSGVLKTLNIAGSMVQYLLKALG